MILFCMYEDSNIISLRIFFLNSLTQFLFYEYLLVQDENVLFFLPQDKKQFIAALSDLEQKVLLAAQV